MVVFYSITIHATKNWLVVSTPLRNISQVGSFPQVGMKIKNVWNHHLEKTIEPFVILNRFYYLIPKNLNELRIILFGVEISPSPINHRILKGRDVIPLIFPKVPQSFLGILKVPQEHPLPLNTPFRQNTTSARTWSRCFSTWRFLDVSAGPLGESKQVPVEPKFDVKIVR